MADVVLAEFNGRAWLVSGEQHIHDLLANTLPATVSVELVACESDSDIKTLWAQHAGQEPDAPSPCFIHPAIVNRIRRASADHGVFFPQWSAMMDDDARTVIRSAAGWAAQNEGCDVAIVRFVGAKPAAGIAELADLRASLVAAELEKHGVAPERIQRETRDVTSVPGMSEESQRVDIVVKVS